MGRPKKQTVDYFPHVCRHGKTMFILEQKYGNDGYAFWFKLLELLGDTEGHYIDCNNPAMWEFLQSKTRLPEDTCIEVLNLLSRLGSIDFELWQKRIIWSENFINGIAEVYRKRRAEIPLKPVEIPAKESFYNQKPTHPEVSTPETRQRREEKRREEKRKEESMSASPPARAPDFDIFWQAFPRKENKQKAIKAWEKLYRNGKGPPLELLLQALEKQKSWPKWTKDGIFPHASTWLNDQRWLDEAPAIVLKCGHDLIPSECPICRKYVGKEKRI